MTVAYYGIFILAFQAAIENFEKPNDGSTRIDKLSLDLLN